MVAQSDGADLTLDVGGDIILDAKNSADFRFKDLWDRIW